MSINFSVGTSAIESQIAAAVDERLANQVPLARSANYRHSGSSQTVGTDLVALQIDGQLPPNTPNTWGYEIWNTSTNRIEPQDGCEMLVRVVCNAEAQASGTILHLFLNRAPDGATPALIRLPPPTLLMTVGLNNCSVELTFFTSQTFLNNGGAIVASADNPVSITNLSTYISLRGVKPIA